MDATLLLVDDESDCLEPMRVLLEDRYRVLTALCGEDALGLLEKEKIEIVIADQRMPGMTGVELLTRVRERYPECIRLILTAYSDFDAMLEAINEGRVYRYIIKPWDVEDMRVTIRQALEWRELVISKGHLAADLAEAHRTLTQRTLELERAHSAIVKQEKMAAVGRFAAEMVHEMNNCLQIIMGLNVELTNLRGAEAERLEQIGSQARALAELTAGIRDFTLGAVRPFSPESIDSGSVAREVAQLCAIHPNFRCLNVMVQSGDSFDWQFDHYQIKLLLLNLLKNAARASKEGGEITVFVGEADGNLIYRVIDHGVGIPAGQRERIWEPFYTTNGLEGSGLGLSICKQIAEVHGGTIVCEETPGGGATFTVRIPMPTR